jgi:hypothetical protein
MGVASVTGCGASIPPQPVIYIPPNLKFLKHFLSRALGNTTHYFRMVKLSVPLIFCCFPMLHCAKWRR